MEEYKSGFIALTGRPNVGKSTLMNQMIGEKVAIVSDKVQTTRNRIQGIYTSDKSQMVFVDTPGVHKPRHRLGDYMVEQALSSLPDVDLVLFLINASQKRGPGDNYIIERLKNLESPVFLIINKIDEVHPDQLLPIIEDYTNEMDFAEVIPVSALQGNNVDHLVEVIEDYLPEGPPFYPEDQLSDHPLFFMVQEIIREKILEKTKEEVPHSVAVQVQKMKENEDGKMEIDADIIIERSSQKGIIIGKGGQMLKQIGIAARKDIEDLLGQKVRLNLWVKVQEDWRDKPSQLKEFGYQEEEY